MFSYVRAKFGKCLDVLSLTGILKRMSNATTCIEDIAETYQDSLLTGQDLLRNIAKKK